MDVTGGPAGPGGSSSPAGRAEVAASPPTREAEAALLADLVARCAQADEAAFAELYDRTSARVYGVVLRVLRSADHASEVTQEIYVQIWRSAARYSRDVGSVMGWVTTMAHRRAVDRVRAVASETARDNRYASSDHRPDIDQVWDRVEQRLDADRVHAGLQALTPIQREALTLAYFGGYTQTQMAELLELPLGTVKTRIRDGLNGLRAALGVE